MEPKMFSFIAYVSFRYNFTYSSVSTIRSRADFSESFSPLTLIFHRNIYVYNSEFVIAKKKNYIKGVCIFLDRMVFLSDSNPNIGGKCLNVISRLNILFCFKEFETAENILKV